MLADSIANSRRGSASTSIGSMQTTVALRCAPLRSAEHGHLAEVVAAGQRRDRLAVALDLGCARQDHVHRERDQGRQDSGHGEQRGRQHGLATCSGGDGYFERAPRRTENDPTSNPLSVPRHATSWDETGRLSGEIDLEVWLVVGSLVAFPS